MMRLTCLFLTVFAAKLATGDFPSDIPQCRYDDGTCLANVITQIVQTYPQGHSGLGVPPLEPLHITAIDITQGSDRPVSINLAFRNCQLSGISGARITRVVGFGPDPTTSKFEVYATVPRLHIVAQYKINGKILVLPIQGEGNSQLDFGDVEIVFKYTPKLVQKNGKNYLQTDKFKLTFDTKRFAVNFENLFNGDRALGDNMNKFLNENSNEIINELKPTIQYTIEQLVKSIIDRIFAKISYDDAFLP